MVKIARKALSKKTRFEVFKRDGICWNKIKQSGGRSA